ncbi:MAG TPA: hypothetical protein VGI71_23815 [Scandinavium sp.]|jgi:hypothetical protein
MKPFRLATIAPFETAIAVLLIISGIAQIAHWGSTDVVLDALPFWEADIFNVVTVIAGVMIATGVMTAVRRIEMAGLLLVLAVFASRFILFGDLFGFVDSAFAETGIFYAAVVWAAIARFRMIRRGDTLVRIRNEQRGE